MNYKSNPRTVLKKIVLLSYTLSIIVFSCIVMGFSKDFAIIYCSATLASVCTFCIKIMPKKARNSRMMLLF